MYGLDDRGRRQALPTRRDVHVLCIDHIWIVTMPGRDETVFDLLQDAEHYGRALAEEARTKLFVHSEYGEVVRKECFAHEGRCRSLSARMDREVLC